MSPASSFIRTAVEKISLPPSRYSTRVQAPEIPSGAQLLEKIDHEARRGLGSGTSGEVKLTVDLDSGRLLAVKQLKIDPQKEREKSEGS